MKLPVLLASLLVASTAYAQAPGQWEAGEDQDLAPPSMAPAAPVVVAPAQRARRWSIGLGIGSLELAPHNAPDAVTNFDIGMLSLRFRPWRHLEIELAVGGGSESLDEGQPMSGARDVSHAVLALRYRFRPQARWNFWVMAGMGTLAVTGQEATDEERDAAQQSTLQFGAGIERRFRRFALQFEVRAVGVAPHETGEMTYDGEPIYADDGMKGGQFALSGNYYF